ncbi:hypothetical protein BD770DRAFT_150466 [Pilaira anomala]|nr:hypothetical protein BD770DRAFT_150466 [Pilaira anomala]
MRSKGMGSRSTSTSVKQTWIKKLKFSWIGYLLNTKTLDVYLDLPKPADIQSFVTTAFSGHPGEQLYAGCVRSIKLQFSPILMDGQFNCKETLTRNLYENFFSAALKMETQTTSLGKSIISFTNQDFLFGVVIRLGQYVIPLAPYGISSNEMLYLLFQAFFNAYVKKQSRYPKFTYLLKCMLDRYDKSQKDQKKKRGRK